MFNLSTCYHAWLEGYWLSTALQFHGGTAEAQAKLPAISLPVFSEYCEPQLAWGFLSAFASEFVLTKFIYEVEK